MFNRCSNWVRSFAKDLRVALFLLGVMGFSTSAAAVTTAVAGSPDTKIAQATQGVEPLLPNSGAGNEEAWIESILGPIDYTQLSELVSDSSNWAPVTDGAAGDYAFDFGAGVEPTHFLVKTGGGGGTGTDDTHYLYDNQLAIPSLQWAYLNLSDFGAGVSLTNIGVISHVGRTGGGDPPGGQPPFDVPEPLTATLGLMGLGVLGMVTRRRAG